MSTRKTVLSAAVLASILIVNVATAATSATAMTSAPAATTAPAAKPAMDMNTMRASKMANHMQKDMMKKNMKLSDEQMAAVKGIYKDMFDKADKFREDMDKAMTSNMHGTLTKDQYAEWQKMHQERQKERMEKQSKRHQKMMKKMQEDNMM